MWAGAVLLQGLYGLRGDLMGDIPAGMMLTIKQPDR